jgi:hypothetical protein
VIHGLSPIAIEGYCGLIADGRHIDAAGFGDREAAEAQHSFGS